MDDDGTPQQSVDCHADITTEKPPLSRTNTSRSFTDLEKEKIELIRAACQAGNREAVVKLAISEDGLLGDEVRREACELHAFWATHVQLTDQSSPRSTGPFLLGFKAEAAPQNCTDDERTVSERTPWEDLPPHEDEAQVQLDVNRSFIYYPTSTQQPWAHPPRYPESC
jgi:hypothetical protein